jgi:regulatory protein
VGRWPAAEPPADLEGPDADPEQVARTILLRRLEAAPRTRAQLATTLRERGVPDDVSVRVLDRFEEVGLIDDRLFARSWVESRQAGRGLSARALRAELRTRGVAEELISEALEGVSSEAEWESARAIAQRKLRSVASLPPATQVRRISGALARKGYGAGLTAQVVREVLDQSADGGVGAMSDDGPPLDPADPSNDPE